MDNEENAARFNIVDLIREIRQTPADLRCSSLKQCFPYVQAFYTPKHKENSVFSYSNKLGTHFIYDDTLRFKKPSFSVNRMFRSIDSPVRGLTPLLPKSNRKTFNQRRTFLKGFNRIDSPKIDKETNSKIVLMQKGKPRLQRSSNKSSRIKPLVLVNHERLSPEILQINKIHKSSPSPFKGEDKALNMNNPKKAKKRRLVIEIEGILPLDESFSSFDKTGFVMNIKHN